MRIAGLIDLLTRDEVVAETVETARASTVRALDLSAPRSIQPLLAAVLAAGADRGGADVPVLAVTATGREPDDLADQLRCLLDPS